MWKRKRRGREIQAMGRRVGVGREREREDTVRNTIPLRHWVSGFIKNVQCTQASFFFSLFDLKGKSDLPGERLGNWHPKQTLGLHHKFSVKWKGFYNATHIPATKKPQVLMDTLCRGWDCPLSYISSCSLDTVFSAPQGISHKYSIIRKTGLQ